MRRMVASRICALVLAAASGQGCTEPARTPGLRVRHMGAAGPVPGLPADVDLVRVLVIDPSSGDGPRTLEIGRADLTDETDYGVVGEVPTERPIELRLEGLVSGQVAYTAVVGPVTLRPGERRYVDILLFRTGAVTTLGPLPSPRALHAATTLSDGRILLSGGIGSAIQSACGAGDPVGSRCFDLAASHDAWLYDPATGRVRAVQDVMTAPRAGHTATPLPDGRVLLAGGFASAQLTLVPVEDGSFATRLDSIGGALASLEVFDPSLHAETDDTGADGDPGRGGFTSLETTLAHARYQHTATPIPGTSGILLAGGRGQGAADTVEVWNGEGIVDAEAALSIGRFTHVAFATSDSVWLIGGALGAPRRNEEVADVFSAGAGPLLGTVGPVTAPEFPGDAAASTAAASLNLVGAGGAPLGDGRRAVVMGWFGPLCEGDTVGWTGAVCPPDDRSFLVDTQTGRVVQPIGEPGDHHAYGAVAAAPDGSVWVAGGFSDLSLTASATIQRLTGAVDPDTLEPELGGATGLVLDAPRGFLAATAQPDGALLVSGGLSFSGGFVRLADDIELVNPTR